jgi:hypothetical protein
MGLFFTLHIKDVVVQDAVASEGTMLGKGQGKAWWIRGEFGVGLGQKMAA